MPAPASPKLIAREEEDAAVLKRLVRPRLPTGLGAAAITVTERIRELGLDAEAKDITAEMLRPATS